MYLEVSEEHAVPVVLGATQVSAGQHGKCCDGWRPKGAGGREHGSGPAQGIPRKLSKGGDSGPKLAFSG